MHFYVILYVILLLYYCLLCTAGMGKEELAAPPIEYAVKYTLKP